MSEMQKIIDEIFNRTDDAMYPDEAKRYVANALIKVLEGLPRTPNWVIDNNDKDTLGLVKFVYESDIQSTIELIRKKVT